jgi:hypothetical protein
MGPVNMLDTQLLVSSHSWPNQVTPPFPRLSKPSPNSTVGFKIKAATASGSLVIDDRTFTACLWRSSNLNSREFCLSSDSKENSIPARSEWSTEGAEKTSGVKVCVAMWGGI